MTSVSSLNHTLDHPTSMLETSPQPLSALHTGQTLNGASRAHSSALQPHLTLFSGYFTLLFSYYVPW